MGRNSYRPRRASKKWLEDAPDYVLACYDFGKDKGVDRYTVLFGGDLWEPSMGSTVQALCLSENPCTRFGVRIWNEYNARQRSNFGKPVKWLALPECVRECVISCATEDDC